MGPSLRKLWAQLMTMTAACPKCVGQLMIMVPACPKYDAPLSLAPKGESQNPTSKKKLKANIQNFGTCMAAGPGAQEAGSKPLCFAKSLELWVLNLFGCGVREFRLFGHWQLCCNWANPKTQKTKHPKTPEIRKSKNSNR